MSKVDEPIVIPAHSEQHFDARELLRERGGGELVSHARGGCPCCKANLIILNGTKGSLVLALPEDVEATVSVKQDTKPS